MKKSILSLFAVTLFSAGSFCLAAAPAWPDITVDVLADQPVATTQNLTKQADGFHRLAITLSNKGKQALTIEKITVNIPVAESLTDNLEVLYGGSCMGRTPLLRQNVGAPTKWSSSNFYEMVRLADGQYLFAGSLSWRIFLPNFTLKDKKLMVWSDGEGKQLKPGETIQYEQIVLRRADDWLALLNQFGTAIAAENGIGKLKSLDFKGWATWDYYGAIFSAHDLQRNLEGIKKLYPAANLFQVDAGWSTQRGDNASVRPDLPGGMKALAEQVKAAGMIPGIWIDGFRADMDSEVFKAHPEYFLRDQDDKIIFWVKKKNDIEQNIVYFDYSHPGARAHMAECIRVIKEEWGIPYFKIDFLRYGLNRDIQQAIPTVKKIKAHDPTITDVERMRLGMQTMRNAVGPENYLLGCSAVFGPCIGFVDGMRTGGDINPRYEAFPERSLANLSHFYLNGKVFNGDIDYLTFRAAADEDETVAQEAIKRGGTMTLNEAQMWADLNKLYGNCRLHSDNLKTLRPERQALVKEVFEYPAMDETVPLDLWQHATKKSDGFELVLARKGKDIYLGVFNWSDAPKDYALTAFGKTEPVKLSGRHSVVLKYDGKNSFAQLCQKLQSR